MTAPAKKQIKIEVLAPKVRTYQIYNDRSFVLTSASGRLPTHKLSISLIVLAAVVGLGAGSYSVWLSKSGQAQPPPQVLAAATAEPWVRPLDFKTEDLNVVAGFLPELIKENHRIPTAEEVEYLRQKELLTEYFNKWKSPFANDEATVEAFLNSRNMQLMIAIAFVESSMGKKCYYNNCSGIGGYPPNLRKYDSHADWIADFDNLLERRYKGLAVEDFLGYYVQPGSPNWLAGVKQILAELKTAGIE
jgi:hypothetical protein